MPTYRVYVELSTEHDDGTFSTEDSDAVIVTESREEAQRVMSLAERSSVAESIVHAALSSGLDQRENDAGELVDVYTVPASLIEALR